MRFLDWWESDERFAVAHEDEATQCRAAWNAALEMAALVVSRGGGVNSIRGLKDSEQNREVRE